MDIERIIKKVLEEMLKEETYKNKCLVLINGGDKNKEEILLKLKMLEEYFEMSYIFTQAGKNIIGIDFLENKNKILELKIDNIDNVVKTFDTLLLPFFTKNSCAKIANGIMDSLELYLISNMILKNKKIIGVLDSCLTSGKSTYEKMLNKNIDRMKEYGVEFIFSKNLKDYFSKENERVQLKKDKKIITYSDVKNIKNKTIILPKGVVISPLAKEKLVENKCLIENTNY